MTEEKKGPNKNRLSLKRKHGFSGSTTKLVPLSKGPSIEDLFKRQKAKEHDHPVEEESHEVEVIEETTSPYFSKQKTARVTRSSRLKLKQSQTSGGKSNEECSGSLSVSVEGNVSYEKNPTDGQERSNASPSTVTEHYMAEKTDSVIVIEDTEEERTETDVLNRSEKHVDTSEKGSDIQQLESTSDPERKDCSSSESDVPAKRIKVGSLGSNNDRRSIGATKLEVDKNESSVDGEERVSRVGENVAHCSEKASGAAKPESSVTRETIIPSAALQRDGNVDSGASGSSERADSLSSHDRHSKASPVAKTDDGDEEDDENQYAVPYYLENFLIIINSMLQGEYYSRLFNKEDRQIMDDFQSLSEEGQKLYVRLFQRKLRWLRASQIEYTKIAKDLTPVLQELVRKGFLNDDTSLNNLEEVLFTLPAPDLRNLAKSLRLQTSDQRPTIIESIQKHAKKKSIGSFFTGKVHGSNERSVLKRGKSLLGCCYKIEIERRWVFIRSMMLFSLHHISGDEDESANSTQLFQMLMANIGQVTYPTYSVRRRAEVFASRSELLDFCSAVLAATDLHDAVDSGRQEEALQLYTSLKPAAERALVDESAKERVAGLPEHLRWFTAGSAYVRALTQGVEALQKARDYSAAVSQLRTLLRQDTYHTDYRGRWYERLALNLHTHLKQPQEALQVIREGLSDPCVRVGHRLAIWQRAQKICSMPSLKKLHGQWGMFSEDPMASVKEAPKVTIEGQRMALPDALSSWCMPDVDGSGHVTFLRHVEDVALQHYAAHGYPEGIHGEGGTISHLFSLLLWDLLFMDVTDAFINPYQSSPLDIHTDRFYAERQSAAEERLAWLERSSISDILDELEKSWNEHENTLCIGVNWERFQNLDHAKGLVRCIGGKILSQIFRRQVLNMRFTRSGFPDLTVWNTETEKFKIVEVKGPGDRLSTKQILWLDYLKGLGVDAEVCYVVAVNTKKLKTSKA